MSSDPVGFNYRLLAKRKEMGLGRGAGPAPDRAAAQ